MIPTFITRLFTLLLVVLCTACGSPSSMARINTALVQLEQQQQRSQQLEATYQQALKNPDPEAQFATGVVYISIASDRPTNLTRATHLFKSAAEKGFVPAQAHLGMAYASESNPQHDIIQALVWLNKAAEQQDVVAQANLAMLYEEGVQVPVNYSKAFDLARNAAEHSSTSFYQKFTPYPPLALNYARLGRMYKEGKGTAVDKQEAYRWLKEAAKAGVP